MKITEELKKRFTSDYKIAIRLYDDPYFEDRLALYDPYFGTLEKWQLFLEAVSTFATDQDYFAEYNATKDRVINAIKSNPAFIRFNTMDLSQLKFSEANRKFSHKDIFHQSNIGRRFVSLDMKKANFNCMRHYDPEMFGNVETWEEFISQFTTNEGIIQSKYIREVIMGQCNCGRHISYEKYLMDGILTRLIENGVDPKHVVFFSNDEVVLDITDVEDEYHAQVNTALTTSPVPLRSEYFTLRAVNDKNTGCTLGYIRFMDNLKYDFKCFNHFTLPFILRFLNGEEITEFDRKVKYENQYIATIDRVPDIEII